MSKNKAEQQSPKPPSKPAPITDLAELAKVCQAKRQVEFTLGDDKTFALAFRQLTPAEEAKLAEIIDAVTPPILKGVTPEQDRVDTTNADYQKKKTEATIQARALGLYWAFDAFRQSKPDLTDTRQITDFIQGQLTEEILGTLWTGLRAPAVKFADLVNFTSSSPYQSN